MTIGVKYFSKQALDNLRYYKYSAEDRSILVKLFLARFWNWIVSFFPMWFAYVLFSFFLSFGVMLTVIF